MPGTGRPGDPLWMAIGFAIGVIPGIYFHQSYAGLGIGIALAVAFGRIREDKRRGYRRSYAVDDWSRDRSAGRGRCITSG
jgi:hypothetical protein